MTTESSAQQPRRQRLILCLDGTWNNRDASTNVFHLYNLIVEGEELNGCRQRKHYLEGVGTGVLDRVSGGGFGFGLEENVRKACDWLIEHYNDGDEIFIFGFSRGAFTARSLVGFLSRLGLLRRGAPLTMTELWQAYRILGRAEDDRANWWERAFGREKTTTRPLLQLSFPAKPDKPQTATENLLKQWSRRVPIKCLGVFDTVGAMGLDVLTIPGLRGNMGAFHNMNLTTLIEHGLHALALDEHRSMFMHTPMSEFIPASHEQLRFGQQIHQRWFAGAHSNIGGGYGSNSPALISLRWMAEEAEKLGLVLEKEAWTKVKENAAWTAEILRNAGPNAAPPLRDSYDETAPPIWKHLIRAKPAYRQIEPPPVTHGPKEINGDANEPQRTADATVSESSKQFNGYSIYSVNEVVDDSVVGLAKGAAGYAPPNLREYAERTGHQGLLAAFRSKLEGRRPWAAESWAGRILLLVWCWLAGVGTEYARHWFFPSSTWCPWVVVAMAAWMAEVDYHENWFNHQSARHGRLNPFYQSWFDVLYWLRSLGLVAFVIGAPVAAGFVADRLWQGSLFSLEMGRTSLEAGIALLGCFVMTLLLGGLPGQDAGKGTAIAPSKAGASALERTVIAAIVVFTLWLLPHAWRQLASAISVPVTTSLTPAGDLNYCGHLLLVLTVFFYFVNSTWWCAEPMEKARLTTIVDLQLRSSAAGVKKQLDLWATKLLRKNLEIEQSPETPPARAASQMQAVVGESLWRDIRGYILIYNVLMALGLWFASTDLKWQIPIVFPEITLGRLHFTAWWWIPLVTAVADWVEDAFHLAYLRRYVSRVEATAENGVSGEGPVIWWPTASISATIVKFGGLIVGLSLTVAAILAGGWHLLTGQYNGGWRGGLALLGSGAVLVIVLFQFLALIRQKRIGFKH